MKVLVMYVNGTPLKEFNNVLQIDYVDYKETQYSDKLQYLSLLIKIEDNKGTKYFVDLSEDVQVSIINDKELENE